MKMVLKSRVTLDRGLLVNACVLLLFISINVYELAEGAVQDLFRKVSLLIIFAGALVCCFRKISLKMVLLAAACFITGLINHKYVGNTLISNQIIIIIYIFASLLLADARLDEKVVRFAVYMNIAVIMFRFMTVGMFQRVYLASSNNFISVNLLLPAVVYYTLVEKRNLPLELYTAFFVWCTCLLGLGRGGILCSSLLLAGLWYIKYKEGKTTKKLLITCLVLMIVTALIPVIPVLVSRFSTLEVFSMFQEKGLESNSRENIWQNYLKQAKKSPFNMIFGGDNSHTIAMLQFNGNTHNTFLNIHVHNGIIPLLMILVMSAKNLVLSVKHHKWIYCLCLAVILLRGFTDMIFWLNLGTPVLFYLLFYQFREKSGIRYEYKPELIRKLLAVANS